MSLLEDRRGDLPDFPLTDLSKDLQGWVKDAANGKACTVDHVAVPLLGVASSLIGVSRRAQASPSWVQPMTCLDRHRRSVGDRQDARARCVA